MEHKKSRFKRAIISGHTFRVILVIIIFFVLLIGVVKLISHLLFQR